MHGPYTLSAIDVHVISASIGAYVLSRNGEHAHYVGRSDDDLRSRIKSSAKEDNGYKQFWFKYATSPMNAYHLECEWYHKYRPTDNDVHPAVPKGTNWKCPVCG